jgi:hypothetical protein
VGAVLRLGDDDLAAQQLDRVSGMEHADLDQPIVLGPRPLASSHRILHAGRLRFALARVNVAN